MPDNLPSFRGYLTIIFGDTVQVRIIEILLQYTIQEQKGDQIIWQNFSDIANQAQVAKSSSKRILDHLIAQGYIEEKKYETHAQNPPRFVRLRTDHPAIRELIFFFKKIRGLL